MQDLYEEVKIEGTTAAAADEGGGGAAAGSVHVARRRAEEEQRIAQEDARVKRRSERAQDSTTKDASDEDEAGSDEDSEFELPSKAVEDAAGIQRKIRAWWENLELATVGQTTQLEGRGDTAKEADRTILILI